MRRRDFIVGFAGVSFCPLAGRAQQADKIPKIGILYPGVAAATQTRLNALAEGLLAAGVPKSQYEMVVREAAGDPKKMPALVQSLMAAKVDLIVAISPAAVMAARSVVNVPIAVNDLETDPVASGLISSLAHPGGNLTGVFFDFPEFAAKWLELLKETLPRLSSVVALWDPSTGTVQKRAVEAAVKPLNIRLEIIELRSLDGLENAFDEAAKRHSDAVLLLSSPVFGTNPQRVADLSVKHRLAAITLFTEFAQAGGLMAYGANLLDTFRQTGTFVGKILRGAKPADLPVERPTKFELVVNLKTAKLLGIAVPTSVLLRADEVIE